MYSVISRLVVVLCLLPATAWAQTTIGSTPGITTGGAYSVAAGGNGCGAPRPFATFPAFPIPGQSCTATDATQCTQGVAVTAGGTTLCPAVWNGTGWLPSSGSVGNISGGGVIAVNATPPLSSSGGSSPTISVASPYPAGSGGTGSTTVPTPGQLLVGNAGGTAYVPQSLSGDCTNSATGAITCTKTNGVLFGSLATSGTPATTSVGGTGTTAPVAHGITLGEGGSSALNFLTLAYDQVLAGVTGSDPAALAIPNCQDSAGQHLNYNTTTHVFSCGSSSSTTIGANSLPVGPPQQYATGISSGGVLTGKNPADADISFSDVLTGNTATTQHGYAPKLDNVATHFLNGQGGWAVPAGTGLTPSGVSGNIQINNGAGGLGTYPGVSCSGSTWLTGLTASGIASSCAQPADVSLTFTDVLTNNASTTAHGYLPKLDGNSAHFLNGAGSWATPPVTTTLADTAITFTNNTTGNVSTTAHGYAPILDGNSAHFLSGAGTYIAPATSGVTPAGVTGNLQINGGAGALGVYGGVSCAGNQWLTGLNASGAASNCAQPTDASLSFSNITTNNFSTSAHGYTPISPGGTTTFLRADGTWATPAASGFSVAGAGLTSAGSTVSLDPTQANTWTGLQTYNNSVIAMLGSSTGKTTITSDNTTATNFTAHLPAANDTIAMLAATQTLTNKSIGAGEINSGTLAVGVGGSGCSSNTWATLPASPVLGTTCTISDAGTCVAGTPVTSSGTQPCNLVFITGSGWMPAGVNATGGGGGSVLSAPIGSMPYYSGNTSVSGAPQVVMAYPYIANHPGYPDALHAAFAQCPTQRWSSGMTISVGTVQITDSNGNLEIGKTAGAAGGSAPSWPAGGTFGTTTTDNTGSWISAGYGVVSSSPCMVMATAGTYTTSADLYIGIGGANAFESLVMYPGAQIKISNTGGAGHAGVVVGNKGSIVGWNSQGSGGISSNGSTTNVDALVESWCGFSNSAFSFTNTGCPNMDVENISITASTGTIGKALLWVAGVEGQGKFADLYMGPVINGSTAILVDDTNQQWNALLFSNVWIGANQHNNNTGIGYDIECGSTGTAGGSQSLQIVGGAIVDFGGSSTTQNLTTPTYLKVHGSDGSHPCQGISDVGTYFETTGDNTLANTGGRLMQLDNVHGFTGIGIVFSGGKAPGGDAIEISGGGTVHVEGKCEGNSCGSGIKLVDNTASGYTLTPGAATPFNYTWSSTGTGAPIVDIGTGGAGSQNPFGPGPSNTYNSAAGDPLPTCSATFARTFVCVSDAVSCNSGTTYASGGSISCMEECNSAGNAWKATGVACF